MITLKYSIEKINPDYYTNKNYVFYQDGNVLTVVSSGSIEGVSVVESEKFVLSVINNCTLIRTKDYVQLLNEEFEKEREYIFTERVSRQLLDISKEFGLLVNEAKGDGREVWLYDGDTGKVVFKNYNHDLARIIGDYLLLLKETLLKCVSMSSGKVLWQIDLVDRKVAKLEINNDLLFIYAHNSNWNDYGVMILNIASGEEVFTSSSFGPDFYLHDGIVYSIGRNTQELQVMDASSFEVSSIELSEELGDFVFETQCTPCFFETELYVALKKSGEDIYSFWGVIDLSTYKLKFKTEMLRDFNKKPSASNKAFVSEIKANKKLIGVKVPGNTLHIFERDH